MLNLGEKERQTWTDDPLTENSIGTESKYIMKIIILAAILQPVLLDMEHTSNINQVNLSSFNIII